MKHYQKLHRSPVFSHEELICKMATIPDSLDLDIAKKVYLNMEDIVHKEIDKRKALHEAVSHLSIQGSHTYSEAQIGRRSGKGCAYDFILLPIGGDWLCLLYCDIVT